MENNDFKIVPVKNNTGYCVIKLEHFDIDNF